MAHDWMIDVLADLRQYAVRNYHFRLAEQLDDAIVTAAVEMRAAAGLDFDDDADGPEEARLDDARDAGAAEGFEIALVE